VDSTPSGTHNAILYMYILPHSSLRSHPPLCALTGWARERGERVVRECGLRGCSVCMPINRANVVRLCLGSCSQRRTGPASGLATSVCKTLE
jgi:hypothetical protein